MDPTYRTKCASCEKPFTYTEDDVAPSGPILKAGTYRPQQSEFVRCPHCQALNKVKPPA